MPVTHKAVVVRKYGSPAVLHNVEELERRDPNVDEVSKDMKTCGWAGLRDKVRFEAIP